MTGTRNLFFIALENRLSEKHAPHESFQLFLELSTKTDE